MNSNSSSRSNFVEKNGKLSLIELKALSYIMAISNEIKIGNENCFFILIRKKIKIDYVMRN